MKQKLKELIEIAKNDVVSNHLSENQFSIFNEKIKKLENIIEKERLDDYLKQESPQNKALVLLTIYNHLSSVSVRIDSHRFSNKIVDFFEFLKEEKIMIKKNEDFKMFQHLEETEKYGIVSNNFKRSLDENFFNVDDIKNIFSFYNKVLKELIMQEEYYLYNDKKLSFAELIELRTQFSNQIKQVSDQQRIISESFHNINLVLKEKTNDIKDRLNDFLFYGLLERKIEDNYLEHCINNVKHSLMNYLEEGIIPKIFERNFVTMDEKKKEELFSNFEENVLNIKGVDVKRYRNLKKENEENLLKKEVENKLIQDKRIKKVKNKLKP